MNSSFFERKNVQNTRRLEKICVFLHIYWKVGLMGKKAILYRSLNFSNIFLFIKVIPKIRFDLNKKDLNLFRNYFSYLKIY